MTKTPEDRSEAQDVLADVLEAVDAHDCENMKAGAAIIARAIREAVEAEREACAKIADEAAERAYMDDAGPEGYCLEIACGIRARSQDGK